MRLSPTHTLGHARCVWHAQPRRGPSRTEGRKTRKIRNAARHQQMLLPGTNAHHTYQNTSPYPPRVPSNYMLPKTRPRLRNYAPPCPTHTNFAPTSCWPPHGHLDDAQDGTNAHCDRTNGSASTATASSVALRVAAADRTKTRRLRRRADLHDTGIYR